VRNHCVSFHPCSGMPDVSHLSWHGESSVTFDETSMPGHHQNFKDTWARVDDAKDLGGAAALELIDDKHGCSGYWVVIGSWFGRVVGRRSGGVLSNVVCRSLVHAINSYAEEWEVDPEKAVFDYNATIGRIEAPGVFRIVHDFDPEREGMLLLDDGPRQLRRDAAVDDVLCETWSKRRWKIRELSSDCQAFGKLKRTIVE